MGAESAWEIAKMIAYEKWLPAAYGKDLKNWPENIDELIWAFVTGWRFGSGDL